MSADRAEGSRPPARVALVPADTDDPIVAPIFCTIRTRGGVPLNMHRALANVPALLKASFDFAMAIRAGGHTTRADRELVILRVTYRTGGDYEHALHISMAKSAGLAPEKIQAVTQLQPSPVFDDRQRAILTFVDEMTTAEGVTSGAFDVLHRFYDDAAIVELTMTAAFYIMGVHITHTLDVQPDGIALDKYGSE